jgi:O-antigen ligase
MFFNGGNLFVKLGKALFIFFVLIFVLIYLDSLLQSGLLERFTNTSDDIEKGANEAIRVEIWKSSIDQFLNNPFFGDKLRVNGWGGYAHNIFIEALQTMGFLGFVPLFILIVNAFKISFSIFRYNKEYAWLSIIFIQAFIQHIFSGAIYTASWLWTSMALLFSINELIKKTKYEN